MLSLYSLNGTNTPVFDIGCIEVGYSSGRLKSRNEARPRGDPGESQGRPSSTAWLGHYSTIVFRSQGFSQATPVENPYFMAQLDLKDCFPITV